MDLSVVSKFESPAEAPSLSTELELYARVLREPDPEGMEQCRDSLVQYEVLDTPRGVMPVRVSGYCAVGKVAWFVGGHRSRGDSGDMDQWVIERTSKEVREIMITMNDYYGCTFAEIAASLERWAQFRRGRA